MEYRCGKLRFITLQVLRKREIKKEDHLRRAMGKFKSKLPPPTHLSSSSSSSGSAPKLTEFFEVECVDIGDHIKIKQCL